MGHLLAIARILVIVPGTSVLYILWLVGLAAGSPSRRARIAVRRTIVGAWARLMCVASGMRLIVEGTPPARPFCLVSNHLSYIDVITLMNCVSGVLISRADVRNWPVFGHLTWLSGAIFVDRSLARDVIRVNTLIAAALDRGDGVIFFPEGTSTRGAEVGRFRSPLLAFAAEARLPVHYASLTYRTFPPDPPAAARVCWWRAENFVTHLYTLLTVRRFEARVRFGDRPLVNEDRKELAAELRERIEAAFIPVIQEEISRR